MRGGLGSTTSFVQNRVRFAVKRCSTGHIVVDEKLGICSRKLQTDGLFLYLCLGADVAKSGSLRQRLATGVCHHQVRQPFSSPSPSFVAGEAFTLDWYPCHNSTLRGSLPNMAKCSECEKIFPEIAGCSSTNAVFDPRFCGCFLFSLFFSQCSYPPGAFLKKTKQAEQDAPISVLA